MMRAAVVFTTITALGFAAPAFSDEVLPKVTNACAKDPDSCRVVIVTRENITLGDYLGAGSLETWVKRNEMEDMNIVSGIRHSA